jgi:hypothetical protein
MVKKIILIIMIFSLLAVLGCQEISRLTEGTGQTSSQTNLKILKAVELGSAWQMKQIKFDISAKEEVAILLKLSNGDKVDGYFYMEKGEEIDFRITGKTLLHKSTAPDRFSFTASQSEGDTYTLSFRNPAGDDEQDKQKEVSVFLEIIYPVSGSIYVPVEGK